MIRHLEHFMTERREFRELSTALREKRHRPLPLLVTGLSEGARAMLIASLCEERADQNSPLLLIVPNEKEITRQISALSDFGLTCKGYTIRDFMLRNITASHEYEHERLSVLYSILNNTCDVVLTTPDAALQYTMPQDVLASHIRRIKLCDPCDPMELRRFLTECGYISVEMVESSGQYSHRGDILDIFPPHADAPIRMEFFGDEIDRMSFFDIMNQRRTDDLEEFTLIPVREVIPTASQKEELRELISKEARKKGKSDAARRALLEEAEILAGDRELSCIDKYISQIYPQKETLIDYLAEETLVIAEDYSAIADRLRAWDVTDSDTTVSMLEAGLLNAAWGEHARSSVQFDDWLKSRSTVIINSFAISMSGMELTGIYTFQSNQTSGFADNLPLLLEEIESYRAQNYHIAIFCEGSQSAKNLLATLVENNISASVTDTNAEIQISVAPSVPGFELRLAKFVALSVCKGGIGISVKRKTGQKNASKKSAAEKIMAYTDLTEGDLVVHTGHGIGQYLGLESLTVAGIRRDFVKIRYAGDDMLYLPCNQLDMLSKYIGNGGDNSAVHLSRMGGAEWGKAKAKAKAATKEMAKELIQLYAARVRKKGFAFSPDDAMTREFADAFEYDETDGQLAAINDIRRDMEAEYPVRPK